MGVSSNKKSKKVKPINNLIKEFLCCKCGEIPEILNAHTDNSRIEFNCKKCGIYEILIDEYFDELSKNNCFKKCNSCQNKGIEYNYYYCFNCKNNYCESCKNNKHFDHSYIEEKEKRRICFKHNKEFKYYCFDCQENFCEEEMEMEHKNHEMNEIFHIFSRTLDENKNKIIEINEEIKNLVEFNETILKYSEILKNNEHFVNSIINMGESLKEENERNSKDTRCLLNGLNYDIENSEKAIGDLENHRKIKLNRSEKNIFLNNRDLDDIDFKYISQIRFNQLKEIDISNNNIRYIWPFKKMNLPFLEFLNMSYNKIKKIEPITKLKSYNLQYIFLQRNNIDDLETFLRSNFPSLKILRVEENEENEEKKRKKEETLHLIKKKYNKKFIYKSIEIQIKIFEKDYELEISRDTKYIDLVDLKGGDEMLEKLFLIITYKSKNKIKKLGLRNNDIKDPSILNRINFNKLEELDLAMNEIKDFDFLSNMKSKNLKYLYLDNNMIEDIYPILNANLPNLKILSLNDNNFDEHDMSETPEYIELSNKVNINGEKISIQLTKPFQPLSEKKDFYLKKNNL